MVAGLGKDLKFNLCFGIGLKCDLSARLNLPSGQVSKKSCLPIRELNLVAPDDWTVFFFKPWVAYRLYSRGLSNRLLIMVL